jgi:hypothetical protein
VVLEFEVLHHAGDEGLACLRCQHSPVECDCKYANDLLQINSDWKGKKDPTQRLGLRKFEDGQVEVRSSPLPPPPLVLHPSSSPTRPLSTLACTRSTDFILVYFGSWHFGSHGLDGSSPSTNLCPTRTRDPTLGTRDSSKNLKRMLKSLSFG